jgi:hypothetical protein
MHIIKLPYERIVHAKKTSGGPTPLAKIFWRFMVGMRAKMVGRIHNQSTPPLLLHGKTTL